MSTIFSAYDIRGRAGETLTVEYAWTVGKAVAEWLTEAGPVVIAKADNASEEICHALTEGVLLQGRNALGAAGDQQAVIDAITGNQAAGGIFISHEDVQGLEVITLFDASGATVTGDSGLATIAELIDAGNFLPADKKGELKTL